MLAQKERETCLAAVYRIEDYKAEDQEDYKSQNDEDYILKDFKKEESDNEWPVIFRVPPNTPA